MSGLADFVHREGWGAAFERVRFELGWGLRRLGRRGLPREWPTAEVLHVLGSEPHPARGGVERATLDRLAVTPTPWALLARDRRGPAELQIGRGSKRSASVVAPRLDAESILEVAARLGARVIHLENLAPFDPQMLLPLLETSMPLVLGLHDLGAACPRPHLFDASARSYCAASADPGRCRLCRQVAREPEVDHRRWRAAAARLLEGAAAVVVPSGWLRETMESALPLSDSVRWHEVAPATEEAEVGVSSAGSRLGLLGTLRDEKGAEVIRAALEQVPALEVVQFGPVHPEYAAWARRRCKRRGFHRPGTLGRQLQRHRVGLGLIGSTVPESHSLVADEAWNVGVPVLAFAHGALATRVGRDGPGALIPLPPDPVQAAAAVAEALRQWQEGSLSLLVPPTHRVRRTPTAVAADLADVCAGAR